MNNAANNTANKTTFILDHHELPACHAAREDIADALVELGFRGRVNRAGAGNGRHSGWLAGCKVLSIEVTA